MPYNKKHITEIICFVLIFTVDLTAYDNIYDGCNREQNIVQALKQLEDKDYFQRVDAISDLSRYGKKEHIKIIAKFLQDGAEKGIAAKALAELGAKEYAKDIAELLKEDYLCVKVNAIKALGKLNAKEYAQNIKALLNYHKEYDLYDDEGKFITCSTVSTDAKKVLQSWGMMPKDETRISK